MKSLSRILMCGALAGLAWAGEAPQPTAKPGVFSTLAEKSRAPEYKPTPDRSPENQQYDKTVLFMLGAQEADGHWDARRWGMAPEFQNHNGDLISTSLGAYVLLCCLQGKQQNPEALAGVRRALAWLKERTQPDGRVADFTLTGEPVVAQMLAGMAYLQSACLSTRDELRNKAALTINYALFKCIAKGGGFGPALNAEPRADVTARGAFLFRSAAMEQVKFEKPDDEITGNLRAGLTALDAQPLATPKGSGLYKSAPSAAAADWESSVSGLLTRVLLLVQGSECRPTINYIWGELAKDATDSKLVNERLRWGANGEGYSATSLWFGTISVVYLFGERNPEFPTWVKNVRAVVMEHQSRDGGWDVAGPDLRYGKIWRSALNALTLILIAPPPPPPAPPPEPETK